MRILVLLGLLACQLGNGQAMRPEVKRYLDGLAAASLESVEHTTDSLAGPKQRWRPQMPAPFPAGRYKAVFRGRQGVYAVLAQTEAQVPHFSTLRPGTDAVDGFAQLLDDPGSETAAGPVLSLTELDFLLRIIYGKACAERAPAEASALDMLKDRLLAIRFSGRPGIKAYHEKLLRDTQFQC